MCQLRSGPCNRSKTIAWSSRELHAPFFLLRHALERKASRQLSGDDDTMSPKLDPGSPRDKVSWVFEDMNSMADTKTTSPLLAVPERAANAYPDSEYSLCSPKNRSEQMLSFSSSRKVDTCLMSFVFYFISGVIVILSRNCLN